MELVDNSIQAQTIFIATDDFVMNAGEKFEIKTPGEDKLKETVPEAKQWRVQINLEITESDV